MPADDRAAAPTTVRRFDPYDVALWLVGGVVLAAYLYDLDGPSVWLDETASAHDARRPLQKILGRVAFPPFYYLALRWWAALFGDDWWTMRVLSAIAGALGVLVFGRVVLALFGDRRLMVTAALVFGLMPPSLQYARQVRMYPFWVLFLLLATLGAVRASRSARAAPRDLALYWIGVACAALTHNYTVFYVVALALGTYVLVGDRWLLKSRADWKRLVLLHGPIVAAAVLQIVAVRLISGFSFGSIMLHVRRRIYTAAPFTPMYALTRTVFFRHYPGGYDFPYRETLIAASIVAALVVAWIARTRRREAVFAAMVALVPLLIVMALPIRSYPRLYAPSLPFLVALIGYGMTAAFRWRGWRWLLVPVGAVWAWWLVPAMADIYRLEMEPWKSVCAVVSKPEPGGGILLNEPYMRRPFDVCYDGPHPVRVFPGRGRHVDPEYIRDFIRDKQLVWVIYSHAWRTDPTRKGARVVDLAGFRLVERKKYQFIIETYRYERDGPEPVATPGRPMPTRGRSAGARD